MSAGKAKENSLGRAQGIFLDGKGVCFTRWRKGTLGWGEEAAHTQPPLPLLHGAGQERPLANKRARLSSGVNKYNGEWPLHSQRYPARHHPFWFSKHKGTGNSGSGAALQGFAGLLIHCVPGTAPGFPSLPPVYKFIKYSQGSQSPEARGDSRKVIRIVNHTVFEGPAGLWKDQNDILPSSTSLTFNQGN